MNKKYLIPCLMLLAIAIASVWTYQKYNQFIPTANAAIHVQNLSEQEIQRLRQNTPITEVKVYKSDRIVKLMHHDQDIRTYPMRLGFDPIGHKVKEGDGKTPEGRYILDWRNPNSAFYKSLHVSYPNQQDKSKANQLGVSPGGDIMIHGSATRSQVEKLPSLMTYLPRNDWTWGCIAVRNIDMDEIWKLVDDGTVISIYS
ncbi:MAG: L,D-transpeptidase family protein [Acinetobacter sp.]|jgi:murein L,D-transpeptidase YafK|uniref:L,D-transpeptidase family protein n=1 Tax=Acinetobacter guillouiae TaxID=106649 RepID=A0A8X8KFT5_ACIGI|nr:L,D-transpeptidase family protein [Acinetobacter guillouiae]MCF0266245.1 L,D-transpeptidase family protein [Acinetobacter guillouiae]MDN5621498.1 L,D-transpeptidase family protein [Acinetobacter sp.]MDN5646828.1 L,D-transpeptidase family protein [Acinetobacter sp.]MDN5690084.1 L,D-transpeptidase family protein [Acinetobacter sp.]